MPLKFTEDFFKELRSSIENKDDKAIIKQLEDMHPADIAEMYDDLNIEEARYVYLLLDGERAADVLIELEEDDRERFLKVLPSDVIAERFIDNMDSDDAADVLGTMSEEDQDEVLSHISDVEQAGDIVDLLKYEEDTAGGLMGKEYVTVNDQWTIDQCISEIRIQVEEVDEVYFVYVIDDDNVLKGIIALKDLLVNAGSKKISTFVDGDIIAVRAEMDSEEVAQIMEKYDLVALPVIDAIGRLIGRITIDDVVDVIREEAEKDYQMMSGLTEDVEPTDRVWIISRARLPWLLIGLLGGILGALVIGGFEEELKNYGALILFLPLIAAMAGNAGVQSSAIIVQAIASNSLRVRSIGSRLGKEFAVSLLNGAILAAILFVFNLIYQDDFKLTVTVSSALLLVVIFASVFGTLIPLLLHKYKIDPAVATGPFITTINDILGLFVYLSLATLIYTTVF